MISALATHSGFVDERDDIDNTYADRYREFPFSDQLEMLLPNRSKVQNLPNGEAIELLDIARAQTAADCKGTAADSSGNEHCHLLTA